MSEIQDLAHKLIEATAKNDYFSFIMVYNLAKRNYTEEQINELISLIKISVPE